MADSGQARKAVPICTPCAPGAAVAERIEEELPRMRGIAQRAHIRAE